jgi:hypothetical protein
MIKESDEEEQEIEQDLGSPSDDDESTFIDRVS